MRRRYQKSPLYGWRQEFGFSRSELAALTANDPKLRTPYRAHIAALEGGLCLRSNPPNGLKASLDIVCGVHLMQENDDWTKAWRAADLEAAA